MKQYRFKQYFLGLLAFYITKLLSWTLRIRVEYHPDYNKHQQYLFAFWHGKQLLPVLQFYRHKTGRAALASPSKDGEILSVCLEKLGYEVVRGSSRHQNVSGLVGMIRKLKQGLSVGFGVDGPLGPLYKVKPGMTHMAQKLDIAIIPVGTAIRHKWILEKAWDRFEIPKPFSKVVCYVGAPLNIMKEQDLDQCNRLLEDLIHEAEAKALVLL